MGSGGLWCRRWSLRGVVKWHNAVTLMLRLQHRMAKMNGFAFFRLK